MTEVALRRYESPQETARRTGLSLRTVRRHVACGLFPKAAPVKCSFWVSAAGARASVRDASVRRGGRPEPQGQTSHPRPGRLTRARASGQAPLRRARDLPVEVDRRPVEDQVAHRGMRTGPHRGRREQPPAQGDGGQQTALVRIVTYEPERWVELLHRAICASRHRLQHARLRVRGARDGHVGPAGKP